LKQFTIEICQSIPTNTKISVYELYKNNISLFDEFYQEAKNDKVQFSSVAKALRIIEDTANLQRRPQKKFREIKGHNLNCKLYEAKANDIRIYLFHEKNTGRIIVIGGTKGNQDKDIKKVINLIKAYHNEKSRK